VLAESGITWLPTLMWRSSKTWRGVRTEVPWIDQPPSDIIRERVRLTLQPVDAPRDDPQALTRTLQHIGSDRMLLFSTDYPHWHFDGEDVLPDGLPERQLIKLMVGQSARDLSAFAGGGGCGDNAAQVEEDGAMNIRSGNRSRAALTIVDCDIHPAFSKPTDLHPFLPQRWREHMRPSASICARACRAMPYPRMTRGGHAGRRLSRARAGRLRSRADAPAAPRCRTASTFGMLMPLSQVGMEERNLEFAAALSHGGQRVAAGELDQAEPRLRGGIVVPQEDAAFAVSEIERRAGNPAFVQILISPRSSDPLGHRRYWPIYEAARARNRPIALHVQGFSGGHASTPAGWPTYYMQEHYAMTSGMQNTLETWCSRACSSVSPSSRSC
jgi:predicted TIM-barrel fold metal-dependent hydrolase